MCPATEKELQQTMDRFWESVPPVWNAVRAQVRATAQQEFDISVEQFHILRHIRRGAHSVSALAEVGRISRPAISQAVDALVHKGMIHRAPNTHDRRFVHLALTPEGERLLTAIHNQTRGWMKARLTGLEPDKLEMVNAGLGFLKEALGAE